MFPEPYRPTTSPYEEADDLLETEKPVFEHPAFPDGEEKRPMPGGASPETIHPAADLPRIPVKISRIFSGGGLSVHHSIPVKD
jgi:hypothetical protein